MANSNYSILDFGARADGTPMTERIQAAIDACFLAGGGTVTVPKGDFITGGIRLRSRVHLYLEEGAQLIGTRDPMDYCAVLTDTLEPLSEKDRTESVWSPAHKRTDHDFINVPGSRWNNALIRAVDAEDIAISGAEGSFIDGSDCYDPMGESGFRGPHAICFHRCRNIHLSGYTVKNSANWAHFLADSREIRAENLSVEGGHDGFHIRSCDNVTVLDCCFATGDDCIAGFDNQNVVIRGCYINTACNGMRFGGTDVLVENCRFEGPARFVFRHSLSEEEKSTGVISAKASHRYNMLSAFTYFSDFTRGVRAEPGNILIRNCTVKNTDRLVHYNFSGNEPWQKNRPLSDLTLEGIDAEGILLPLNVYGDGEEPITLTLRDVAMEFLPDREDTAMMNAFGYSKILLERVSIKNAEGKPLIRVWSVDGEIETRELVCDGDFGELYALQTEPFHTKAI